MIDSERAQIKSRLEREAKFRPCPACGSSSWGVTSVIYDRLRAFVATLPMDEEREVACRLIGEIEERQHRWDEEEESAS